MKKQADGRKDTSKCHVIYVMFDYLVSIQTLLVNLVIKCKTVLTQNGA
jgi:hypothetical protein